MEYPEYKEAFWYGDDFGIKYSDEEIRTILNDAKCPLNNFVGNEEAVDLIKALSFYAWKNNNHAVVNKTTGRDEKMNIALLGSAGLGKTTLAKLFAKTVGLPFVELHRVKHVQEIFDLINKVLSANKTPIGIYNGELKCPPCIVFVDEVHRYTGKSRKSPSGIMNDLLKVTEPDDAILTNGRWVLDCKNICWVVATTEWHLMPTPFRTRFMEIKLRPYTLEDVTEIVKRRFPDIPLNVCEQAANYGCLIPRQALSFAKMFDLDKGYQSLSWEDAAKFVADKKGIDEYGMTSERRNILILLNKYGTISRDRLCMLTGLDEIELFEMVIPPLVKPSVGEALIQHGRQGWFLSSAGKAELKKRGIVLIERAAS